MSKDDLDRLTVKFTSQLTTEAVGEPEEETVRSARSAADVYLRCIQGGALIDRSGLQAPIQVSEKALGAGGFGAVFLAKASDAIEDEEVIALEILRQKLAEEKGVNLAACHERAFTNVVKHALDEMSKAERSRLVREGFKKAGFRPSRCVVKISWETMKESGGRLKQEMKAAGIAHPGLGCPVYSGITTNERVYHLLPYYQAVFPSPEAHRFLTFGEILEALEDLARALVYLSRRGMTHRDLKPENLIYLSCGEKTRPILLDLGIVKLEEGAQALTFKTREGLGLGSYDYMAPEQVRDASACDGRTDVFGFGGVAYQLLTGSGPNQPPNPRDLLQKLANARERKHLPRDAAAVVKIDGGLDRFAPLRFLGLAGRRKRRAVERALESLRLVVAGCLQTDMDARYPQAEALLEDVQAVRLGRPPAHAVRLAASQGGPLALLARAYEHPAPYGRAFSSRMGWIRRVAALLLVLLAAGVGSYIVFRAPIRAFLGAHLPGVKDGIDAIEERVRRVTDPSR